MSKSLKLNTPIGIILIILSITLGFFLGLVFLSLDIVNSAMAFGSTLAACLIGYLLGKSK